MMPQIHKASVAWMNYALCVSTGAVIPLVYFTKEKYVRADLDTPLSLKGKGMVQFRQNGEGDSGKTESGSTVPYNVMQ